MKSLRSRVRVIAPLAVVASLAASIAAFVGCGSDDGNNASPNGGNNEAGANNGDGSSDQADSATCAAEMKKLCDPDAAPCGCGLTCNGAQCTAPAACDDALISWTAPTSNSDGTCLRDLAGFVIYSAVDASGGPYTSVLDAGLPCVQTGVAGCGGDAGDAEAIPQLTCSYRVQKLPNGTWYFVMTSYNDAGVESVQTGEVSKVITCPGK